MNKAVCFVIMPFGRKPDAGGRPIDFDAVYDSIIEPAIVGVGLTPMRADKELGAAIIHKAMFERLILSAYAVADLTVLNANVYYELGMRHAARPQTTVLVSAEASRLPFDVGPLQATPYSLDPSGRPDKVEADRAGLIAKLAYCLKHDAPDSPLFTLIDGWSPETTAANLSDIADARRAAGEDVAALQAIVAKLDPLRLSSPRSS